MLVITCVHQGFELYGSDRSFIETVGAIRGLYPDAAIEVVLPRDGPIVPALEPLASKITIEPLWILRRKNLPKLATIGLLRLPFAVMRAWSRLKRSDIVYINTSVVADYMLAAALCRRRSIIHIHEIASGATRRLLRLLVRLSGASIIFNSRATRDAFALPTDVESRVIYNGLAGPDAFIPRDYDGSRPLRILMLGRFSRIKGQEILVEALRLLPGAAKPEARIVGGAFEDDEREKRLAALIADAGLAPHVELMAFTPDPAPLYRWADIVVVPSRLPESLGRVAIEAMAYGRPPLVSRIGGLPEVVEDGASGWLVPPDSAPALASALHAIIENPAAWRDFPAAGRARYEALFSQTAFDAALKTMLLDHVASNARGGGRIPTAALPGKPA